MSQQINRLDVNKTGLIEFKSYIHDAFDNLYDSAMLEKLQVTANEGLSASTNVDDEFQELRDLYDSEKEKWHFISPGSKFLTHEQFYMFIYTEEYPALKNLEAESTFKKFDLDGNGYVSVAEFSARVQGLIYF